MRAARAVPVVPAGADRVDPAVRGVPAGAAPARAAGRVGSEAPVAPADPECADPVAGCASMTRPRS